MDPQVFYEVVVPLLGLRDTAMIAISTILDPSNFYTKLVDMKDANGKGLFDVQRFELVCAACRATDTPWKCTHMTETMPPWLSEDKHTKIRSFLPPELVGRETMGITMTDATKAFEGKLVTMFESAALQQIRINYSEQLREQYSVAVPGARLEARVCPSECIYTAVDPNGGGASEYAIASVMFVNGMHTIVGLDAKATASWRAQREMLLTHVRSLRERPELHHIPIVLVVESNLGFEAAHNARYVVESGIDNIEIAHEQDISKTKEVAPRTLHQYATNSVGIRTTHQSKERMYIHLRQALEDNTLRVWNEAISSTDASAQVKKLIRQLHNYSAIHSDPKALFGMARRVFTGKAMGEQDDLIIALMISMLYRRLYVQAVMADNSAE